MAQVNASVAKVMREVQTPQVIQRRWLHSKKISLALEVAERNEMENC